jgi:hypothetical protein
MTERERQYRLRIQNRLEELNAKYGPVEPLEDWGEEYFRPLLERARLIEPPPRPARPAPGRKRASKQTQLDQIAKLDEV